MSDPAVLFYTSDFLVGVMDMTMEERGQYITLLCYQHQKGHLDEKTIRLLVGLCSVNVLKHFKQDGDGKFYNERMDLEKAKRHKFNESRRKNGKLGGRPKKEENENHMVNHMGNENENNNINNNINNNNINSNINIYDFIEQNFSRTLSPIEYEEISTWEDNELTRYAIKQSVLNGKYNLKYIARILDNYKKNGIITIQQAQEDEKKFKSGIKKNSNEALYDKMSEWARKVEEKER